MDQACYHRATGELVMMVGFVAFSTRPRNRTGRWCAPESETAMEAFGVEGEAIEAVRLASGLRNLAESHEWRWTSRITG